MSGWVSTNLMGCDSVLKPVRQQSVGVLASGDRAVLGKVLTQPTTTQAIAGLGHSGSTLPMTAATLNSPKAGLIASRLAVLA